MDGHFTTETGHLIESDHSSSGHARLTCWSCDMTLVRQPYMSAEQWQKAGEDFQRVHGAFRFETFTKS